MSGISEFTQAFFNASSKAWKKNKVKYDQACYTYKEKAFPKDTDLPVASVSKASKLKLEHELHKRHLIDEPAPLRVRRSPRIREQHLRETYSNYRGKSPV